MIMSLEAAFKKHLDQHLSLLTQHSFIVGYSGGLDSTVLVFLCYRLNLDFALAHCNFKLRNEESERDEKFVKEIAVKLGVPLFTNSFDTINQAEKRKESIQVTARRLRYDWFLQLIKKEKYNYIVTAHHLDDSLETFIINLSRGTGLEGLTGIPEINHHVIRPLLPFSRGQLKEYAQQNGLLWREDSSNAETKYLRNQLRHQVIPELKKVHVNLLQNFSKTTALLKQSQDFIDDQIKEISKKVISTESENQFQININALKSFANPKFILYHLLKNYGFTAWDDIYQLLNAQSGKYVNAPGYRISKHRKVLIIDTTKDSKIEAKNYKIQVKNKLIRFDGRELQLKNTKHYHNTNKNEVFVDKDKLKFPLFIIKPKEGDYFYPLGMKGKKKISKFFKDEKLSLSQKEQVWLLVSGSDIVWIIGYRADDRFKIESDTTNILKISYNE